MAREAKTIISTEDKSAPGVKSAINNLLGLDDAAKKIGKTFATAFTVTAIAASLKQVVDFGVGAYKAFAEAEKAAVTFNTALTARTDISRGALDEFNAAFSRTFGVDSEALKGMETLLISSGRTQTQIEDMMTAANALSVATGKDLKSSVEQLNKTFGGTAGELGELIPEMKALTKEQFAAGEGVDVILGKFGHLNDTVAGLADTKLKNLSNAWGDLQEAIGGSVAASPLLEEVTSIVDGWARAIAERTRYQALKDKGGEITDKEDKQFFLEKRLEEINDKKLRASGTFTGLALYKEEEAQIRRELAELSRGIAADRRALEEIAKASPPPAAASSGSGAIPSPDVIGEAAGETINLMAALGALGDLQLELGMQALNAEIVGGTEDFYAMQDAAAGVGAEASAFGQGWKDALEETAKGFQDWGSTVSSIVMQLGDGLADALMSLGDALYEQTFSWSDMGAVAVKTLSQILTGLGAQLAALAAVNLLSYNWVGAAMAAAASAAAFVAAGFTNSWAKDLAGGGSDSRPLEESSPTSSGASRGAGAAYTGAQTIIFNFYNQGNVVGSGGMEELAGIMHNIIQREARYS